MAHELAVVMPVYNEEACIRDVVNSWRTTLDQLDVDFYLLVLNDGSTDGTGSELAVFDDDRRVEVVHKPNEGHGPTVLTGYRRAARTASWVFQCDSDGEIGAEHFRHLWNAREGFDALFGKRYERKQGLARMIISVGSRVVVRALWGKGIPDVNTPYRLIRSRVLEPIVERIPHATLAPNVIISGVIARSGLRILNHPVPHEGRKSGTPSIAKLKLWLFALHALWQTITIRPAVTGLKSQPDNGVRNG